MDVAHFYQEWLQIEVSSNKVPNYYEVLGLENAEPNLQTIAVALNEKLDNLSRVDASVASSAYATISRLVLEARYTLLDSQRKLAYDTELLATQGVRAWKSYKRPSFLERCRQICLIAVSFSLGCCIMFVMASMVERNPDGSIIYHAEVKVTKPKPFTTPLETVVYRPIKAHDFQEDGYVVTLRGIDEDISTNTEVIQDTGNIQVLSSAEIVTNTSELVDLIPSTVPDEKSVENSEFMDGLQDLLPDTVKPSAEKKVAVSTPPETLTEIPKVPSTHSPLYALAQKTTETSNAEENMTISEIVPQQDNMMEPTTPELAELSSMPSVEEKNSETVFSPEQMLSILDEVSQTVGDTKEAQESMLLVKTQMCIQILMKCQEKTVVLEPMVVTHLVQYTLEVARNLGYMKHFNEAETLLDELNKLGKCRTFAPVLLDEVHTWQRELKRLRENYQIGQETYARLQTAPDDPVLNTRYAVWLWSEKRSFSESLPFLMKSQHEMIRVAATWELKIKDAPQTERYRLILQAGDLWWRVSKQLNKPSQKQYVIEHVRELYKQVDPNLLSEEQFQRLANLEK